MTYHRWDPEKYERCEVFIKDMSSVNLENNEEPLCFEYTDLEGKVSNRKLYQ